MLDIKFIREHVQEVKDNLIHRHNSFDLDEVLDLDSRRRNLLQETEQLKNRGMKRPARLQRQSAPVRILRKKLLK